MDNLVLNLWQATI